MSSSRRAASLRFRLTAIATSVAAIVLAATAFTLASIQERQLTANLDASLEQRADSIAAEFAEELPDAPIVTNDEDRAVQLVGSNGAVLASSVNLEGDAPLPIDLPADGSQLVTTHDDLPLEDDSYRVLSRLVDTSDGPAILHVAENADDLEDAIRNLATALLVAIPAVVVLLAALIWWLTGRTLRPVDTIRAEVDRIDATDSRQRLQVPDRDDEISRLASTMNRMLDRLNASADQQRRFVADAAHELRTPLTRIRTDVEVDLDRPDHADPAATNRAIRDEIVALQSLIDDLLHLARSDAGGRVEHRRPVDLDDIVLAEIRQQRAVSDVAIDATRVSAAHLEANAEQLTRAVRNLLTNAARHAATTVTVSLRERNESIELSVADDGPGIGAEHSDRIFERFARLDDARTRDEGGTGLGLAITKDIVDQHGGTIEYDATWTNGARFVLTLPSSTGRG
jgi:signal transduction histidine kinase